MITVLAVVLCGCWDRRELNALYIVTGLSIDAAKNGLAMTIQVVNPSAMKSVYNSTTGGSAGGGDSGSKLRIIESSGKTVNEAVHNFAAEATRQIYLAHNQVIVFGKSAASQNVYPYIDYFYRSPEIRPSVLMAMTEGRGSDIMRVTDGIEPLPSIGIADIIQRSSRYSYIPLVTLQDFAEGLMSETDATVLPIFNRFTEAGYEWQKQPRLRFTGTGVFKKGKLVGKLSISETEGLLFAQGKVKNADIDTRGPGGETSMTTENSYSQVTPEIKNGELGVTIEISVDANYSNEQKPADVATASGIPVLEKAMDEAVRQHVLQAWNTSRRLNADIFNFGDVFHRKYPSQWRQMAPHWDDLYRNLHLEVSVKGKIHEVGLTSKPVYPQP